MFEDEVDVYGEEIIKQTREYQLTRDPVLLQYPRAFKMYCNTLLRKEEIGELCKIPMKVIEEWEERYDWIGSRVDHIGAITEDKLKQLELNGAEAYFVYGGKVRDQVRYVGNMLSKKLLLAIGEEDLKFKDIAGPWIKLKELESELSGERQEMNQTNIQINFSDVYAAMKEIRPVDVEGVRTTRELIE